MELNEADRQFLTSILRKPKAELTKDDIDVLNARRAYLTEADRATYNNLLIQDSGTQQEVTPEPAAPATTYEEVPATTSQEAAPETPAAPVVPQNSSNPYEVNPEELS